VISRQHDQETQVRKISAVFAEEKPEDKEAPEFGNLQYKGGSSKTRASGSVF
jgi:hypothetical protein